MPAIAATCRSVFPAHAGMIPVNILVSESGGRVPRACGDDPGVAYVDDSQIVCSPRMRG